MAGSLAPAFVALSTLRRLSGSEREFGIDRLKFRFSVCDTHAPVITLCEHEIYF